MGTFAFGIQPEAGAEISRSTAVLLPDERRFSFPAAAVSAPAGTLMLGLGRIRISVNSWLRV